VDEPPATIPIFVSYSKGGMIVAGRLREMATGHTFHELLERDVFAAAGMDDACTSAERAILRSTAVGHFPDALVPMYATARPLTSVIDLARCER
jgi:CubicO group peptidase (beta-lactamase class C family)